MSKLRCFCSTVISMSGEIPNPIEWKTLADTKFEEFDGRVDSEEIYRACGSIFRCPPVAAFGSSGMTSERIPNVTPRKLSIDPVCMTSDVSSISERSPILYGVAFSLH